MSDVKDEKAPTEKVKTISLVAHENTMNRLYKVIRILVIALIAICVAFVAYISYDRYLDTTSSNDFVCEQNAQDNGNNAYAGGDYIVSANSSKD